MKRYLRQVRLLATLGVLAAFAPSLLSASSAQAACTSITGSGSSVQAAAQTSWSASALLATTSCGAPGTLKATYTGTASGQAIEEWGGTTGALAAGNLDAFVGVEAPATATIEKMDKAAQNSATEPNGILTIPNAQEALAQIVTLPVKCTIKGGKTEIKTYNTPLAEIWQHAGTDTFTSWLSTFETAEQVEGTGCSANPKLYVRSKTALTTLVEKTYLNHFSANYTVDNKVSWPTGDTAANTISGTPDKTYGAPPTGCTATETPAPHAGNETDPEIVENVYNEPGAVSYVGLADAEANNPATSKPYFTLTPTTHVIKCKEATGEKKEFTFEVVSFFLAVQNNGTAGKLTAKFASPVGSGGKESNCSLAKYSGEPTTNEANTSWSAVTQENWKAGEGYPKCFLTYDLAWRHYNYANLKTGYTHGTQTQTNTEETVVPYQKFILGTAAGEGQALLTSIFYSKLPTSTLTKANQGQALIGL